MKSSVDKSNSKLKMGARSMVCDTYDFEVWGEACVTADPEGGYVTCSPYLAYTYTVESCYDDGYDPYEPPVDPPYEGTDPCIDFGQCNDGGSSSSQPIVISLSDRIRYPIFAKIVDGIREKVIKKSKLMESLKKFSTLSESQILENLTPGKGPEIYVVDTLSSIRYGVYNHLTHTITLNSHYVSQLNTIYPDRASMFEFFIVSTVFHEFVHFGNDLNSKYLPKVGWLDVGAQFENEIYGGYVSYDQTTGKLKYTKIP